MKKLISVIGFVFVANLCVANVVADSTDIAQYEEQYAVGVSDSVFDDEDEKVYSVKYERLYYLLDWESVSRNRKTLEFGYNDILIPNNRNAFCRLATLNQLNILLLKYN